MLVNLSISFGVAINNSSCAYLPKMLWQVILIDSLVFTPFSFMMHHFPLYSTVAFCKLNSNLLQTSFVMSGDEQPTSSKNNAVIKNIFIMFLKDCFDED